MVYWGGRMVPSWCELALTSHYQEGPCDCPAHHSPPKTEPESTEIRRAHRDGLSIRAIARTFGHSRHKIRQILSQSQPQPYTRTKPPPAPVLGPFHGTIDALLAADEHAPRKQR